MYNPTGLSFRERAILHSGTQPYKDPGATIRAFGALNDPSVRLYVAGNITVPMQEAVDALPSQLRGQVTLLGDVDGQVLRKLHGQVRVASFPTRYAIPVASATVMEAVASGTPIIGSHQVSRDILVEGCNGRVVDTNPDAMAVALRALLKDDALWSRLSAGACRMIQRFDAVCIAQQYVELATQVEGSCQQSRTHKVVPDSQPRSCDEAPRQAPIGQTD
jgi:glycosyltransferase involved in cell wall biosynthesis